MGLHVQDEEEHKRLKQFKHQHTNKRRKTATYATIAADSVGLLLGEVGMKQKQDPIVNISVSEIGNKYPGKRHNVQMIMDNRLGGDDKSNLPASMTRPPSSHKYLGNNDKISMSETLAGIQQYSLDVPNLKPSIEFIYGGGRRMACYVANYSGNGVITPE
jgi:hypothetical protein